MEYLENGRKAILTCRRHVFALATTCLSALSIGEAVVHDDDGKLNGGKFGRGILNAQH